MSYEGNAIVWAFLLFSFFQLEYLQLSWFSWNGVKKEILLEAPLLLLFFHASC